MVLIDFILSITVIETDKYYDVFQLEVDPNTGATRSHYKSPMCNETFATMAGVQAFFQARNISMNDTAIYTMYERRYTYLTIWNYTFTALVFPLSIIQSIIALRRQDEEEGKVGHLSKTVTIMAETAFSTSATVVVLFWVLLGGGSACSSLSAYLNIDVHGLVLLYIFGEILLGKHQVPFIHIMGPLLFGVAYVVFSAIYVVGLGNASNYGSILDFQSTFTLFSILGAFVALAIFFLIERGIAEIRDVLIRCRQAKSATTLQSANANFDHL
eukprot:CAMPEP_0113897216 /NCGR_PEP_ID=MMETSP0780_2-20120614/18534_1 /TAXON_ID=652834 /ORGANISM="Palpitomonas bilix" /LENGTH=270 /DNA_ID=CAMNT_0000888611 /DNA_START=143 /DNA_END=955 /DNA_ORIENTATION=+ /assembly_acc=CAM_ASM_000599